MAASAQATSTALEPNLCLLPTDFAKYCAERAWQQRFAWQVSTNNTLIPSCGLYLNLPILAL
jgi:hypothetical protein